MTHTDFTARNGSVIDPWGVAYTPAEAEFRAAVIASVALDLRYDDEFAEASTIRLAELIRASRQAQQQGVPA
ncbi:hypothetical protein [Brevundimonas pondensis]|uniref:Uncharacterized protein n=1 Tax=Brevundimonas pondensis TaxID=2774189 RepID=A0ABX7SK57_9CAUL|nr:hypothetical protein [Brevundimonas pondensis]QTC88076.1 hypothetical protein IFE19_01320 [Brevundimonas pondensis]